MKRNSNSGWDSACRPTPPQPQKIITKTPTRRKTDETETRGSNAATPISARKFRHAFLIGKDSHQQAFQPAPVNTRRSESIRLNSTRIFDQDGIPTIPTNFPRPVSHIQCFFILVFTIPSYCRRRQRSRIFSCHRHSSLAAAVLNYYPPPSLVASVLSITAAKSPPSPLSNATNFVSFRPITHQRHE